MRKIPNNYDNLYRQLLSRLSDCDFDDACERLGLTGMNGGVLVELLKREYLVDRSGVFALDNKRAGSNAKSVLIHYVTGNGFGEPSYSFVPLNRLTGMLEGRNELGGKLFTTPLTRAFGNDYPAFERSALRLGGVCESSCGGRYDWVFTLLPKLPAKIVFYEADDEFSAEIQLMLDERAPRFLEFECLAFLMGCFSHALLCENEG